MTLAELKQKIDSMLETCTGDETVYISCKFPHASIGPSPKVQVASIHSGFDWNHGKIILQPEKTLYTDLEVANHASRTIEEIMCWIKGNARNPVSDEKLLKTINNVVDSYERKVNDIKGK